MYYSIIYYDKDYVHISWYIIMWCFIYIKCFRKNNILKCKTNAFLERILDYDQINLEKVRFEIDLPIINQHILSNE